jgi:hypothetical protein
MRCAGRQGRWVGAILLLSSRPRADAWGRIQKHGLSRWLKPPRNDRERLFQKSNIGDTG